MTVISDADAIKWAREAADKICDTEYFVEGVKLNTLADYAERLQNEVERLRQRLLTAAGDDLCRLTQEEIKSMSAGDVPIPPKEEFLASCERFHSQVAGTVGVNQNCLTLAQLIAENERLTAQVAELETCIQGNEETHNAVEARLSAEIERLRAALEKIGGTTRINSRGEEVPSISAEIARAALSK